MTTLTHEQLLAHLRRCKGTKSMAAFARELNITRQHLYKVLAGTAPAGPKILEVFGLEKIPCECPALYRTRKG